MLRKRACVLLIVAVLCVLGCSAHTHNVGHGPAFDRTTTQRQWYLLYGLVAINDVDTHAMAQGRRNYEITTQVTLIDFIYQAVLSPMTITCRTVSVTR